MFTIVLIVVVILIWFWLSKKPKVTTGGFGTKVVIPDFQPGPRPDDGFIEPTRQKVTISVQRNSQGVPVEINIENSNLVLQPDAQVAWSAGPSAGNDGGKVEIRFSPNSTPFTGAMFATPRGGVALSGPPTKVAAARAPQAYTILVTTPDGYLLDKQASLTISTGQGNQTGRASVQALSVERAAAPEGGFGDPVEDPKFELIDRPAENAVEPEPMQVVVGVVRGNQGEIVDIVVRPENLTLSHGQQAVWTAGPIIRNEGGKVEIRFAPNATPFGGDSFATPRGGKVLSGAPIVGSGVFEYLVLITTPDGFFQKRQANPRITVSA